ncbi:hypothetical protein EP837_03309 [Sphingobium sp. EP60837]|nr:hypothetical protein EP837_03309 [Sphingobium sp. EP60837]
MAFISRRFLRHDPQAQKRKGRCKGTMQRAGKPPIELYTPSLNKIQISFENEEETGWII